MSIFLNFDGKKYHVLNQIAMEHGHDQPINMQSTLSVNFDQELPKSRYHMHYLVVRKNATGKMVM